MIQTLIGVSLLLILAAPTWAGEAGSFDPDQPFEQALSQRFLQSLFSQVAEALDEHFDIAGNLSPDGIKNGQRQSFRFKFYPEGKSKSDRHITAEGWFGPSRDSQQQELHFRFALPKSLTETNTPLPENVL
jgi:hypothetical protein